MATCPRCGGALTEHHRCRWREQALRRALSRLGYLVSGAAIGSVLQMLVTGDSVPVMGAVIGAILFIALREFTIVQPIDYSSG